MTGRLSPALDWSRCRLAARAAPCRVCGALTRLQDPDGVVCHKTCAESRLVEQLGLVGAIAHSQSQHQPKQRRRKNQP